MARNSNAWDVLEVLENVDNYVYPTNTVESLTVMNLGTSTLGGKYTSKSPDIIPTGFHKVCELKECPAKETWEELNGLKNPWFQVKNMHVTFL